jgi:putative Ig domain-containing protein/peptidase M10/serralysin-like protein/cadherin-like protein
MSIIFTDSPIGRGWATQLRVSATAVDEDAAAHRANAALTVSAAMSGQGELLLQARESVWGQGGLKATADLTGVRGADLAGLTGRDVIYARHVESARVEHAALDGAPNAGPIQAPTAVGRGNVAIVSYETDLTASAASPDALRFVVLESIGSGTVIYFTDRFWNGSSFAAAGGGDGTFTYTAGSDIAAGTVITLTGAQLAGGGVTLSNAGETVYAYQGSGADTPSRFLFAIDMADGNAGFSGSIQNTGLTVGVNAVAVAFDNASYAGQSTQIAATQMVKIATAGQWHGSDNDDNLGTPRYSEVTDTTVGGPLSNPDMQMIAVMAGGGQSDAILRIDNDEASNAGTNLTRLFRDNIAFNHLSDLSVDLESGFYFLDDSDGNSVNRILRGNVADLVSGTPTPSFTSLFATDGFGEIIPSIEIDKANNKIYWLDGDLFGSFEGGWELHRMNYDGSNNEVVGIIDDENPNLVGFPSGVGDFALDPSRNTAYIVSSNGEVDGFGNATVGANHILKVNSLIPDPDANDFTVLSVGAGDGSDGYMPGRLDPSFGQIINIDVDQTTGVLYFTTQPISATDHGGIFKYDPVADVLTTIWVQPSNSQHNTLQPFPQTNIISIEVDEVAGKYYVTTSPDTDTAQSHDGTASDEGGARIFVGDLNTLGAPVFFATVFEPTANGGAIGMELDYAPTVGVTDAGATYTETAGNPSPLGAAVAVATAAAANDADTTVLQGATIAITAGFVAGVDALSFTDAGGITGSYNATLGVLTLTGAASFAQYQAALNSIGFTASGDNPTVYGTNTERTISFTLFDGLLNSDPASATVTVEGVNDAPVNTVPGSATGLEDTLFAITGLSVNDIDANAAATDITVTISADNGTLLLRTDVGGGLTAGDLAGNGTASVTITATMDQINATFGDATGVRYQGDANFFGTDTFHIVSDDGGSAGTGGALSDTDTFSINVTAVNDDPVVDQGIADQIGYFDEPFSFTIPANAFDDIDGDDLDYAVQLTGGGALPSWLSFNPATGQFSGTPDETEIGTYSIDVTADDGNGGTVTDTFEIEVTGDLLLYGDAGANALAGHRGDDTVNARAGDDTITGGMGGDVLRGQAGDDYIAGGNAGDKLQGGDGNDTLVGGFGRDVYRGGDGDDVFVYETGDVAGGPPRESIRDFVHGDDLIDLSSIDANGAGPGDTAFTWIGDAKFSGAAGELRYEAGAHGVVVSVDTDGDQIADFQIGLAGLTTLAESDFIL